MRHKPGLIRPPTITFPRQLRLDVAEVVRKRANQHRGLTRARRDADRDIRQSLAARVRQFETVGERARRLDLATLRQTDHADPKPHLQNQKRRRR